MNTAFADLAPAAQAAIAAFQAERDADDDWQDWAAFETGTVDMGDLLGRLETNDTCDMVRREQGRGPSADADLWPLVLGDADDDVVVIEDGYHRLAEYAARGIFVVPFVRFA